MSNREIREQIDLSTGMALGIVMQGFRIRMGRSLITLLGIVFGIAFLMANFTNQIVRDAVRDEEQLRSSIKRMMSFLIAETGPLQAKTVGIIDRGDWSVLDTRFAEALTAEGATVDAYTGRNADAVVALGRGPLPDATVPADRTIAVTAPVEGAPASRVLALTVAPTDAEVASEAAQRAAAQSRYWWILAISVIVTFMGITNAMLMSVTERFREIGTMKCLGAKSAFIRRLFLIESLLLGLVGGVLGACAGAAFSVAVNAAVYGLPLVLTLSLPRLTGAAALCVAAGALLAVASALSPAHVAATMTPAHALRSNV